MFESLQPLAADPILGVIAQFNNDPRNNKIDLGVGVYRDEQGNTPILAAVKRAEEMLFAESTTKAYVGPLGNIQFNQLLAGLLLGDAHPSTSSLSLVQTPGGCGALRVAAEFIKRSNPSATIWVSDPTWGNHVPLLGDAGIHLRSYPYYDFATHTLKFDEMMSALDEVKPGDLVLLHACCHNPSGTDLSVEQWQAVVDLAQKRGFVPFIDIAYQGFGQDLDSDAYGVRLVCEQLPEAIVAISCSKNFGLYRERVGAVAVLSQAPAVASSHIASIVRGIYSMPPDHGAAIVARILADEDLRNTWVNELTAMRNRIRDMRVSLVGELQKHSLAQRFSHIERQQGMFSFLGLTPEQVTKLADEHAVYMVESSRINLAGLTPTNIPVFADALSRTL